MTTTGADRTFGFRTRALHAGGTPDSATGARAVPIYQSTSFVFESTDDAANLFSLQKYGNIYSRLANPTVAAFEERIASLEGGIGAVATASGMSAEFIVFAALGRFWTSRSSRCAYQYSCHQIRQVTRALFRVEMLTGQLPAFEIRT